MGEKSIKLRRQGICLALAVVVANQVASAQMARAPRYRPPDPAGPVVRVDGQSRGPNDATLTLTVLAPEHVGLTTQEQPSLYWYQSKAMKTHFELTIIEPDAVLPVLEVKLNSPGTDCVQRLSLKEHDVKLKVGVEYKWSVEMVVDRINRSRNVLAGGVIKRVAMPAPLAKQLEGAPESELPFIYADNGMWYDCVETLSNLIDKLPTDKSLHEERGMVFMQAKLSDAARFEFKMAGQAASSVQKK